MGTLWLAASQNDSLDPGGDGNGEGLHGELIGCALSPHVRVLGGVECSCGGNPVKDAYALDAGWIVSLAIGHAQFLPCR